MFQWKKLFLLRKTLCFFPALLVARLWIIMSVWQITTDGLSWNFNIQCHQGMNFTDYPLTFTSGIFLAFNKKCWHLKNGSPYSLVQIIILPKGWIHMAQVISYTGSALYWTLWVLLSTMLCEHSPTEIHKRSRPFKASLPECTRRPTVYKAATPPDCHPFLFSEQDNTRQIK